MRARKFVIGLALLGSVLVSGPVSADCVDYRDFMHWIGGVDAGGYVQSVDVSGSYAYITVLPGQVRPGCLKVVDISNPRSPRIVGTVDTPGGPEGTAKEVKVRGAYAYVADGTSGFQVIDVGVPENPRIVGSALTPYAWDVAIDGAYAYVVGDYGGMDVVDISDPQNPQVICNLPLWPYQVTRVAVSNGYAYVVAAGWGLKVIDVHDPHVPQVVGGLAVGANCVAVAGRYAYVGDGGGTLRVVDVVDPANPVIVASVDLPGLPGPIFSISVEDGHLCIAREQVGLCIVDVTDPLHPGLEGYTSFSRVLDVAASGGFAFVADPDAGLEVIQLGNHQIVPSRGSVGFGGSWNTGMDISGTHAYVVQEAGGFFVLDLLGMSVVGSMGVPGNGMGLAIDGNHAYVASADSGLQVVDVVDPAHPRVVGRAHTVGSAQCVTVMNKTAYVGVDRGSDQGALYVIDVSVPGHPSVLASLSSPGTPLSVAVSGTHAYIGTTHGWPRRGELLVIDCSDPFRLRIVGSVDTPQGVNGIAITGHYAALADSGLQMLDIADPQNPRIVGTLFTGNAQGVKVLGDTAYLVDRENVGLMNDLMVIDIGDPRSPRIVGNTPLDYNWASGVSIGNGFVVAATFADVQTFPLQCPTTEGVTEDEGGARVDGPDLRVMVTPNPTQERAVFRTRLEGSGRTRITIYDAAGRWVRLLHDGLLNRGVHDFPWDGRDEAGRRVAAGVYLARVATEDASSGRRQVTTARIVILR